VPTAVGKKPLERRANRVGKDALFILSAGVQERVEGGVSFCRGQ
jgi:hypothetical protein